MDSVSLSNKDVRKRAASERRAARQNSSSNVGINFLSSLSMALDNIDRYNNDVGDHGNDGNGTKRHVDSETITLSSVGINCINNTNAGGSVHNNSPHHPNRKPSTPPPSHFSSYLKFNRLSIKFLLGFAACYILFLTCFYPMVYYSNVDVLPTDDDYALGRRHHIKRGASFEHIRGRKQFIKAKQALGKIKDRAVKWEEQSKVISAVKREAKKLHDAEKKMIYSIVGGTMGRRDGEDAMKASLLLEQAVGDFEKKEAEVAKRKADMQKGLPGHDHWKEALESWDKELAAPQADTNAGVSVVHQGVSRETKKANYTKTPGFMVLGMHRSGTSMLSGLLVKGFGYETGGPLIGASFDNEKGFYERIDVVLQNDEFMEAQRSGWSWNVLDYDPQKALEHNAQGTITFKEGRTALAFLNNPHRALPYLQKDPRMCITLPTWLKLLDHEPAIVFTYRHPLEVALSLKHREQDFTMEHGLRLWIAYNMRALQYSAGLCRVYSTNEAVFNDPAKEVQRIKDELTFKCNVKLPLKNNIPVEVVNAFVDPKLQHNKKGREADKDEQKILKDFGNGCVARDFDSDYDEKSANRRAEVEMYLMTMQIFCDLEHGQAYEAGYKWPDLLHWQRPAKIS